MNAFGRSVLCWGLLLVGGDGCMCCFAEADTPNADTGASALSEIVVTAEKRQERLQDVPIAITALNASSLETSNQVTIQNYFNQVPGLSIAPSTVSSSNIAIRGITTGAGTTAATVSVLIDDVPFGSSGGQIFPDLDPGDLQRIEVLRGPQGTLYGASGMGGIIKFVTKEPSSTFTGQVSADANYVQNSVDPGYAFRGSVSGPVTNQINFLLSGYSRRDAGFIDNPLLGVDGINQAYAEGGHLAVVWHPSEDFSAHASSVYQTIRADAPNQIVLGQGLTGLQQNYVRNGAGYERTTQADSVTLDYKFGRFDLTSLTGYNQTNSQNTDDFTPFFAGIGPAAFGVPSATASPTFAYTFVSKVSEELRLSGSLSRMFDVRLGLFYTHEVINFYQAIFSSNPITGAVAGVGYNQGAVEPSTNQEYAVFGDVTFRPTETFDVQLGFRRSEFMNVTKPSITVGPAAYLIPNFFGPGTKIPVIGPEFSSESGPFTFSVTPEYKWTPNLMTYLRVASGYRDGGSNASTPGVPQTFGPDKTLDYELGVKGDLVGKLLTVDASVYYIDWSNIQILLIDPSNEFAYTGNAGHAVSKGIELALQSQPTNGLTLSTWVAISRAEVTSLPPPCPTSTTPTFTCLPTGSPLEGSVGQSLPWSPRISGNFSAEYEFPLGGNLTGFGGGALTYIGDREDGFTGTSPRGFLGGYAQINAHAGVQLGGWRSSFYINNLANRRGLISGGDSSASAPPGATNIITPRMIGLNTSYRF